MPSHRGHVWFAEHLPHVLHDLGTLHSTLQPLQSRYCYPCLTDEQTEAQGGGITAVPARGKAMILSGRPGLLSKCPSIALPGCPNSKKRFPHLSAGTSRPLSHGTQPYTAWMFDSYSQEWTICAMRLRVPKSKGHACSLYIPHKPFAQNPAHHRYLKFQWQNTVPFLHTFSCDLLNKSLHTSWTLLSMSTKMG